MKVLHVASCLVNADGHSQFCMTLAERLAGQGMARRIFSLPHENGDASFDPRGVALYAIGQTLRVMNVLFFFGLKKQLIAVVRDFKPDAVHLHGGWRPV